MVFCRYCGREIAESAQTCPQCGGVQQAQPTAGANTNRWMPITSMILGILSLFGSFEPPPDQDTAFGLITFAIAGLLLGCIGLAKHKAGKGMAIAGVIMASVALLALIGMLM